MYNILHTLPIKGFTLHQKNETPFAQLVPNVILDAIESAGFFCTGSLLALNSYENRVYQIGIYNSEPLIV